MPNWCKNRIRFDSQEDLQKAFEKLGHPEAIEAQKFSYKWVVPYPKTKEECIKKYGKECITENPSEDMIEPDKEQPWLNWYNFHNTAWGCKWDASEVCIDDCFLYFDSPWGPPDKFIDALAKKLDDVPFTFTYAEEQGNIYCGEFCHNNGCEEDYWYEFDEGSEEASEAFNELWGETYFVCEDGRFHADYESDVFTDEYDELHYFDYTNFSEENKKQAKKFHTDYESDFDDFIVEHYNNISKDDQRTNEAELLVAFLKEAIGFYKPVWDNKNADPEEYEVDHEYKFVSSFEEEYAESFES